jgi:hypothetical protein
MVKKQRVHTLPTTPDFHEGFGIESSMWDQEGLALRMVIGHTLDAWGSADGDEATEDSSGPQHRESSTPAEPQVPGDGRGKDEGVDPEDRRWKGQECLIDEVVAENKDRHNARYCEAEEAELSENGIEVSHVNEPTLPQD